jgi:hypothetical protein
MPFEALAKEGYHVESEKLKAVSRSEITFLIVPSPGRERDRVRGMGSGFYGKMRKKVLRGLSFLFGWVDPYVPAHNSPSP